MSRSGRENVQRVLITAAVPVFLYESETPKRAKEIVIRALQASIQSGEFLVLAQEAHHHG